MICKDCKTKPVARGIKFVKCLRCNKDVYVNCFHSNICTNCSDNLVICQYCGKEIKQIEPEPIRAYNTVTQTEEIYFANGDVIYKKFDNN